MANVARQGGIGQLTPRRKQPASGDENNGEIETVGQIAQNVERAFEVIARGMKKQSDRLVDEENSESTIDRGLAQHAEQVVLRRFGGALDLRKTTPGGGISTDNLALRDRIVKCI